MESARPKVCAGSILHRLLGVTPGYAPTWLSSRDSCNGFDLLATVQAAGFFTTIVLVWALRGWGCLLGLPLVAGCAWLASGFTDRERFGRARLFRGECVWCGRPSTPPGDCCPACQLHT